MTWLARGFPRTFGTPNQVWVKDMRQLVALLNRHYTHDCYVSVNSYPQPNTCNLEQIAWDFDGKNLESVWASVIDQTQVFDELGIEYKVFFSGKKGFHIRVPLKIMQYKLHDAKSITKSIQQALKSEYSDIHLYGDVRRILRFPNTINTKSGLYCVEVNTEMTVHDILEHARGQHKLTPINKSRVFDAHQTLKLLEDAGLTKSEHIGTLRLPAQDINIRIPFNPVYVSDEFLDMIFPQLCIRRGLMEPNPAHIIRVASCVWLEYLGYDLLFLYQFYSALADKYKWVDRHNVHHRNTQIYSVYIKNYMPYGCGRLVNHCIGGECKWKFA